MSKVRNSSSLSRGTSFPGKCASPETSSSSSSVKIFLLSLLATSFCCRDFFSPPPPKIEPRISSLSFFQSQKQFLPKNFLFTPSRLRKRATDGDDDVGTILLSFLDVVVVAARKPSGFQKRRRCRRRRRRRSFRKHRRDHFCFDGGGGHPLHLPRLRRLPPTTAPPLSRAAAGLDQYLPYFRSG